MKKESELIWEAYTNKQQVNEHHAAEWPDTVLDMPLRALLDKLKEQEQTYGELYRNLEDFIKKTWSDDFKANQESTPSDQKDENGSDQL